MCTVVGASTHTTTTKNSPCLLVTPVNEPITKSFFYEVSLPWTHPPNLCHRTLFTQFQAIAWPAGKVVSKMFCPPTFLYSERIPRSSLVRCYREHKAAKRKCREEGVLLNENHRWQLSNLAGLSEDFRGTVSTQLLVTSGACHSDGIGTYLCLLSPTK